MTPPFLTALDRPALAAAGVPEPWAYGMADRVRFAELDALAHVNHTAYLRWFEALRVHYVRDYGISPYDGSGPRLVLRHVEAGYRAPMFLGEDYIVTARTASFRRTSLRMEYAVFAPDLRAEGAAVVVLLERGADVKMPLTEAQRATLAARDGAVAEG